MRMKKLALVAVALLASVAAHAQFEKEKFIAALRSQDLI